MTDTLELSARKIAQRGREELLAKLRPAFAEAASAHADVLKLDPEQLEQMVQRAADRADGLQWRRALASVATEELGIGLGEALGHPAVQRAQAIVGAPSYEESLSSLSAAQESNGNGAAEAEMPARTPAAATAPTPAAPNPTPTAATAPTPAAPNPTPAAATAPTRAAPSPTPATATAPTPSGPAPATAAAARPAPSVRSPEAPAAEQPAATPAPDAPRPSTAQQPPTERQPRPPQQTPPRPAGVPRRTPEPSPIRVAAIHLGGVTDLRPGESEIELRLSDNGLDIARGPGEVFGRLTWGEIHGLEVPPIRGFLRRRREPRAHLVVRAEHGDASFEIPAVTPDELREHLQPLLERHGHASDLR